MNVPAPDRSGPHRPGGRSARVRAAVLAAVLEELSERGYGGLTVARIADRGGVHRTTVHRRWPDLGVLVTEALLDSAGAAISIPDRGDVQYDLATLLCSIAAYLEIPGSRQRIRGLLADAARSPAIATVVSRVWSGRLDLGQDIIRRAVARGELRDDLPPATILAAFTSPLYVHLLTTEERIDGGFVGAVVDVGLHGARRTGQSVSAVRAAPRSS